MSKLWCLQALFSKVTAYGYKRALQLPLIVKYELSLVEHCTVGESLYCCLDGAICTDLYKYF